MPKQGNPMQPSTEVTKKEYRYTRPETFQLYPDQIAWIGQQAQLASKSPSLFLRELIEKARAA